MACRVNHLNKKTGITYVYESVSFWNKEKKQPRNKQVCVGKIDPVTGDFVPSKRLASPQGAVIDPAVTATTQIIGPSLILDAMDASLGLKKILKKCFPDNYQQIMLMAYYLVTEGGALSHCETWCKSHAPSWAHTVSSQRISEILRTISMDHKQTFLKYWMRATLEDDYLCYDITSISSYSEGNAYVKQGYNRDKEKLPQINLSMLFSQNGRLPVYFESLPGSITDVTTLHNMRKSLKAMELKKLNYIMDKGFYSEKNINELVEARDKFLIAVPLNSKWVQNAIDDVIESIELPDNYRKIDDEVLYVHSSIYAWGDEKRRCYLHLYYNSKMRSEAVDRFNENLVKYRSELETGNKNKDHQHAYDTFFVIKTTPKRGEKVSYNMKAVKKYIKRYTGIQALLSNQTKDPVDALQCYRNKDVVEKCFDDLKNQIDMKRLRIHNPASMNGRLLVQFVALIYLSALRNTMRASSLIEKYTSREILKEMETLVKIHYSGKYGHILTEMTKDQREILQALKITLPT